MKAEKINELYDWLEGKDIRWSNDTESYLQLYQDMSKEIFDGLFDFDELWSSGEAYFICTVYKNIEWKQGYSCVVDWECEWGFDDEKDFVLYIAKLYDRAMEILND